MNNTENIQINDSVKEPTYYERKQKIFEYIEIEHNFSLRSDTLACYHRWLENSRNENFWDRATGK